MKYLYVLLICFFSFSCQKQNKVEGSVLKDIEKVRILSYPSRTFWDTKNGKFNYKIGIKNNKIEWDTKYIVDDFFLNKNQQIQILNLLNKDLCGEKGLLAAYQLQGKWKMSY